MRRKMVALIAAVALGTAAIFDRRYGARWRRRIRRR